MWTPKTRRTGTTRETRNIRSRIGNKHNEDDEGLSEYEENENRRRLTAIVETLEEDRDYWLAYIDEHLKEYQEQNKGE